MDHFEDTIRRTIEEESMLRTGDHVIVGISGGADSVCLLHILTKLKPVYDLTITGVHINHGLRGEQADRDQSFSEELCSRLGADCRTFCVDIKALAKERHMTEEEAGRSFRYECFEAVRDELEADKIAVAHHMNDLAETVILNLCRGTGLKGMCGIPPVRGAVIRPLINVLREEIEEYVREQGLSFCNDMSNFEDFYSRNKIRLEVIPYLEKNINAGVVKHIHALAKNASFADAYIRKCADEIQEGVMKYEPEYAVISSIGLLKTDPAITGELIRRAIDHITGSLKDVTYRHVKLIQELAEKGTGKQLDLPYGLEAVKDYDRIIIRKHREIKAEPVIHPEKKSDADAPDLCYETKYLVYNKKSQIPKNRCTKWFDYDRISCSLVLRTRMPGDYMCIKGGMKKTIKRVFTDDKVSRDKRDRMLMFADGDHIVWIPGLDRISEAYKVSEDTVHVLEIRLNNVDEFV